MAIEVLATEVANQIAAGEVVSRPASVVKELLENSLDSGATRVQLVIKDAGKTLIQVSDNGCGMDFEDAQKCFLAHATSKIKHSDDLLKLTTMGFRGEALSSIAAIAHVELRTRREGDEIGTRVIIEGGKIKETSQIACPEGTCISVKNLFFNTPARRNFLKSEQIENNHISEEFIRCSMINTSVSWSYINNEKPLYRLTVGSLKKRITDLMGNSFSDKLIPIAEKVGEVEISGFVGSVEGAKRNKSSQYFFVNGRYMRNSYFANAIDRAYANLIPEKTYPSFFVLLNLPPENIDVNIHPTKTEIKFIDDKLIYSVLHAAVKKSIGQYSISNELDFSKRTIEFPIITSSTPMPKAPQINFNPNFNPFESTPQTTIPLQEKPVVQPSLFEEECFSEPLPKPQGCIRESAATIPEPSTPLESAKSTTALMQIANRYIAVRSVNSLLLIDQSRASERIIYESVLTNRNLQIYSQRLVTPQKHVFPPSVSFQLVEYLPLLKLYGIEMEYDKADGGFLLLAKPINQTPQECFELAQEIIESNSSPLSVEEREHQRALRLAQRLKTPYGESLSENAMQTLVSQLFSLSECSLSPEGKKIVFRMGEEDLEKLFE